MNKSRAELEVELAKKWEKSHSGDAMLGNMVDAVYDDALELYKEFVKRADSGMSTGLILDVFNKLARGQVLSPLTGDDDEWSALHWYEDEGRYSQQNKRMTTLFRYTDKNMKLIGYSYNYIIEVVNDDEVWQKYPPYDEAGSLDDDDPRVKKYFEARDDARKMYNSGIKFPLTKIKTHKFRWDFKLQRLIEVL